MATVTNPPSKSAAKKNKKKEANGDNSGVSKENNRPIANSPADANDDHIKDADDASSESPYIKELQKNIRNVNKKLVRSSTAAPFDCGSSLQRVDEYLQGRCSNSREPWQLSG